MIKRQLLSATGSMIVGTRIRVTLDVRRVASAE